METRHGPTGRTVAEITLAPVPESPRAARLFVAGMLDGLSGEAAETVALLVSELVTNAVLHAHTDLTVSAQRLAGGIRVAVRDGSPMLPAQRDYDSDAMTGRGLGLVEMLATDFGIDAVPGHGKTVWFVVGGRVEPAGEDGGWDAAAAAPPEPAGARDVEVHLDGVPVNLYRALEEHHEALLREQALVSLDTAGGRGVGAAVPAGLAELAGAERVSAAVSAAVAAAASSARGSADAVDVTLQLSEQDLHDIAYLQDVIDAGEALAREGRLLTRPALPELRALRRWIGGQVERQAGGEPSAPWSGAVVPNGERYAGAEALAGSVPLDPELAVVAADDSNRVIAVTARAAELLGWAAEELIGQRVPVLIPPRLRDAHVAGFTRFLLTGEARQLDRPLRLPALHRDGSELDCEITLTSRILPGGRLVFLATLRRPDGPPGRARPPGAA